jgi:hypothetical protein
LHEAVAHTPHDWRAAMLLSSLFDSEPPHWQTWVIPAAGLLTALTSLFLCRFILSHWRSRARSGGSGDGGPDADRPAHDPFEQGSVSERRVAPRRKGNPIEVLVTDEEATREPARACVLDRSMGGMCLLLNEEVAPGTVLSVKPRKAPESPWVQVEVRSCKRDRSGYETGCQFVRTPPWAVMLLFG